MIQKPLTKSRFKLGLECPNKLFYTGKKEYADIRQSDPFLEALAEGGFQVEELARMHFPNGTLLEGNDWDYHLLWNATKQLLEQENVTIYEPAFFIDGLFIRVDVLVKKGNDIELIEIKSKSYDPNDDNIFVGKRGGLVNGWKPYLFDIAFQKYVVGLCFPKWSVNAYVMMADKTKTASVDRLNQMFRIDKTAGNRTGITKTISSIEETGNSVLGKVQIDDVVEGILNGKHSYSDDLSFHNSLSLFKEKYSTDTYANWKTSFSACKNCQFKTTEEDENDGLKSGFKECFQKQHGWTNQDFLKPSIFDIWSFRRGAKLFDDGMFFMDQLSQDAIGFKQEAGKLSTQERQWIQIEKAVNLDNTIYVNAEGLKQELDRWAFPLHFIDFETCAAALPFNKGRKPYEQIAFQFSHHIYDSDGIISHVSEYINGTQGVFPNFEFIRELKNSLESDSGTILRYSHHENTILNAIYSQLMDSNEEDKDELIDFIKHISHSKSGSAVKWAGPRDMVDLLEVVKKYYYNPATNGSNSIKDVLPAALGSSEYLQDKYSKPLKVNRVGSLNFPESHVWLQFDGDTVINPYKQLPPVFEGWTEEQIENTLSDIEDIANGGAALTAYAKLQYTDMTQEEVMGIKQALLKYCELDTLAMVMIYEHLRFDLLTES